MCAVSAKSDVRRFVRNCPNVSVTNNYETILNDDSVQTVVIATPADTHFQFIQQSLDTNRLHVYTEKPLALSTKEAEELVAAAQKSESILMVGICFCTTRL